jgi:predicted DNA binding CopG/RHH family protein
MQAAVEPSPTSSSFAGVLAALTGARIKPSSNWEDDLERDLERDVATLSYERALSTHARYRPDYSPDHSPNHIDKFREDSAARIDAAAFQPEGAQELASRAPVERTAAQNAEAFVRSTSTVLEEKRMRASVTLRMSKSEFAQLQQRAAEAGLSVSAYLRSCTFEVEALRAQVKQALAELRTARRESSPESSQPPRTSLLAHFLELIRIRRPAVA